jgi:3-phenylpropionate/trans-cinnamate dioxygenase ferredoxin reductase component
MAGLSAARALRALGYDGPLVLVGAEQHAPYDRPPLSKAFLGAAVTVADLGLAAPGDGDLGLEARLGVRAVALCPGDRTVELESGERLGGTGVVIATGARARRLHGPELAGVRTLRTLDDATALRQDLAPGARLVVVGGGFVGAEVAATARGLGVDVALVEGSAAPLSVSLGPEVGQLMAQVHSEHGVRLVTGVPVAGLVPGGGTSDADRPVRAVRLADGRELEADVVLVAVGSEPETDWLHDSGLDVVGGVLTDVLGATAVPGVVATGDCARRFEPAAGAVVRQEHWTNALQHPQLAAAALLGVPPPLRQVTARVPYVWSDQYDLRLQFAGHRRPGDVLEVVEGSLVERAFVAVFRRDGAEVGVVAVNSPREFVRRRRRLAEALPG